MIPIIYATAGSRLYGTHSPTSDHDTMGIGVANEVGKLGLDYVEQIGADDAVVYEISKFVRLAIGGNPTIIQLLFTPQEFWLNHRPVWEQWQLDLRHLCLSERARASFLGYMEGQRRKTVSGRGQRPELIAKHGYDTKFAAHMLRLGFQGVELLTTGQITLPMPENERQICRDVLDGHVPLADVLGEASGLEFDIKTVKSVLPETVDRVNVNYWLADAYQRMWRGES